MSSQSLSGWDCSNWQPQEIIALGYMDGPTSGVLRLKNGYSFVFNVVAFDFDRELRVLTLGSLSDDDYDLMIQTLRRAFGDPHWPTWVPLWRFDDVGQRRELESIVNRIIESAIPIAAAVCDDTIMRCVSFRSADINELSRAQEWFEFMGISDGRTSPQ